MKILLDYDATTGEIKDRKGMIICNWVNLDYLDPPKGSERVEEILALKLEGNFNAEEIRDLLSI